MPEIKFINSNRTVSVPEGTVLLEAARLAGVSLEAPCGGKGTCGKCLVRVVEGDVSHEPSMMISPGAAGQGYVRACSSRVRGGSVTVEVPESIDAAFFSDDGGEFEEPVAVESVSMEPLSRKVLLRVPLPAAGDGLSDLDRLTRTLGGTGGHIDISLPVLGTLAGALRSDHGRITATVSEDRNTVRVIRVQSGDDSGRNYGIAVDVGTTTIAVQLIDLVSGRALALRSGYNDQVSCGLDVISRINYARKKGALEELRDRVRGTINRLAGELADTYPAAMEEITAAVLSGNTVMTHLLLGIDPEYIRLSPYTPTMYSLPLMRAGDLGIDINPDAAVGLSPCVGSYVGGDITAGLLCTPLAGGGGGMNLFIDIGTNGELAVGNADFLMACACSAGPAFEGGGIDCGMRAAPGAIGRVLIDPDTGEPSIETIGGTKPRGICGSGMIDLLAGLFRAGLLDQAGKFSRDRKCPRIISEGRSARYMIVPPDGSAGGNEIYAGETDIENIMRAKAAIYSAISLLLTHLGADMSALERVYVAGGFGKFLDLENAVTIGLLPDIPRKKFEYIGNASLRGSAMALLSRECRDSQNALSRRMTYVDPGDEPLYMDQYTAALFLPHTDTRRFPSVKRFIG